MISPLIPPLDPPYLSIAEVSGEDIREGRGRGGRGTGRGNGHADGRINGQGSGRGNFDMEEASAGKVIWNERTGHGHGRKGHGHGRTD